MSCQDYVTRHNRHSWLNVKNQLCVMYSHKLLIFNFTLYSQKAKCTVNYWLLQRVFSVPRTLLVIQKASDTCSIFTHPVETSVLVVMVVVCVCLSVTLCVFVSHAVCVCQSLCVCLSVTLCVCLSVTLCVFVSHSVVCLSVTLCVFVSHSVCVYGCWCLCLPVH